MLPTPTQPQNHPYLHQTPTTIIKMRKNSHKENKGSTIIVETRDKLLKFNLTNDQEFLNKNKIDENLNKMRKSMQVSNIIKIETNNNEDEEEEGIQPIEIKENKNKNLQLKDFIKVTKENNENVNLNEEVITMPIQINTNRIDLNKNKKGEDGYKNIYKNEEATEERLFTEGHQVISNNNSKIYNVSLKEENKLNNSNLLNKSHKSNKSIKSNEERKATLTNNNSNNELIKRVNLIEMDSIKSDLDSSKNINEMPLSNDNKIRNPLKNHKKELIQPFTDTIPSIQFKNSFQKLNSQRQKILVVEKDSNKIIFFNQENNLESNHPTEEEALDFPFRICFICDQFYLKEKTFNSSECDHTFCKRCGKAYYEEKVEQGEYSLKCPVYKCKKKISEINIKNLISEKHFILLENSTTEVLKKDNFFQNLSKMDRIKLYTQKHVLDINSNEPFFIFNKAKEQFCIKCHEPSLYGKTGKFVVKCLNCYHTICKFCMKTFSQDHFEISSFNYCKVYFRRRLRKSQIKVQSGCRNFWFQVLIVIASYLLIVVSTYKWIFIYLAKFLCLVGNQIKNNTFTERIKISGTNLNEMGTNTHAHVKNFDFDNNCNNYFKVFIFYFLLIISYIIISPLFILVIPYYPPLFILLS